MAGVYEKLRKFKKKYPLTVGWRLKSHCKIIEKHLNPGEEVNYVFVAQKTDTFFDFISTYVIAFYANEIPIDGGPESINGLPGMILGLVVPSQHLSYFATKVEFNDGVVLDKKIFDNAKTQRMSRAEIDKMMTQSMSNFMNKETVKYIMKLALL